MTTSGPAFTTRISSVAPGHISIRGTAIEELIGEVTSTEAACLVIKGSRPSVRERRMIDAIFASAADHGFVATCTAATRYAASGSGSIPAAVAAGILGIGSSTAVPHVVAGLLMSLTRGQSPKDVSDDQIDAVLRDFRDRGQRVPGIGHPVHRAGDPRTDALRRVAKANDCYDGNVALMDRVVDRFAVMTGRKLPQNVDGILAAVLLDFDWTPDQIFGLTILILTPSLVAHAIEEIDQGNVMRIIPADQVRYDDAVDPPATS